MNVRRLLAAAVLVGAATAPAAAQSWRTFSAQRALGREDSLRVVVAYGLGKFVLRAAPPATLYDIALRYDADVFRAEKHYDAATHTLRVGADSATAVRFTFSSKNLHPGGSSGRAEQGTMALALAPGIPLDLTVELGIAEASFDFGGLWVDRAHIEAAMGAAKISFPTANVHPMRELSIEATLGGLEIDHLGNARAQHVTIDAALGGGVVDLRGDWTGEMTVTLSSTLGGFHISAPTDAGVRINATTRLSGMTAKGFTQRGNEYYSPNYDSAKRKITIDAKATLAGYEIGWVAP